MPLGIVLASPQSLPCALIIPLPIAPKKENSKVPHNFQGISPLALNKFLASPSVFLVLPFIPWQAHFLPQRIS